MYQWKYPFFGLPASYRAELYEELFTLCYYGNGFNFREMYDLPVEKRRFLLKLLENAKIQEKELMDRAQKKSLKPSSSYTMPSYSKPKMPKK